MGCFRLALLFLAAASAHASVSIDRETGLWFPPYGTKQQYLANDPKYPYGRDVDRAFAANPSLMKEVCAATSNEQPVVRDERVRQKRVMLGMLCISHDNLLKEAEDPRLTLPYVIAFYYARAAEAPISQPRFEQLANAGIEKEADLAFQLMALNPSDTRAIAHLLRNDRIRVGSRTLLRREVAEAVERIYRARMSSGDPDAWRWRDGLPMILLYRGNLREARVPTRRIHRGSDTTSMDREISLSFVIGSVALLGAVEGLVFLFLRVTHAASAGVGASK